MKVYNKNDVDVTFSNEFMDLEQLTSFDAIPLEKVKRARRELDKLPIYGAKFTDEYRIHLDREEVFSILDKLIAESEG